MDDLKIKNLLIIGVDVASLAYSALKAGYKVYSVDYFGDQDLKGFSIDSFSVIKQREGSSCGRLHIDFNPETLLKGAKKISVRNKIDAILLSTGLEDSPTVLSELQKIAPIIGNSPEKIQNVRDKERFIFELEHLGISFPETFFVNDFSEAISVSKDIGYPVVIKPTNGFSGFNVKKVETYEELVNLRKTFKNSRMVIQKYVIGIAASVSVVSSKLKSIALTVNEQLLGPSLFSNVEPFRYCGNIVPLFASDNIISKCRELAEKLVSHYELIGSNGIDLLISKDGSIFVVEINPRFQGSLECIENVLGINMVETHLKACLNGLLPEVPKTIQFCTRIILFAPYRSIVTDLSRFPFVRDVPLPKVIIEKGEPVCSVIVNGEDRSSSFKKAKDISKKILSSLKKI